MKVRTLYFFVPPKHCISALASIEAEWAAVSAQKEAALSRLDEFMKRFGCTEYKQSNMSGELLAICTHSAHRSGPPAQCHYSWHVDTARYGRWIFKPKRNFNEGKALEAEWKEIKQQFDAAFRTTHGGQAARLIRHLNLETTAYEPGVLHNTAGGIIDLDDGQPDGKAFIFSYPYESRCLDDSDSRLPDEIQEVTARVAALVPVIRISSADYNMSWRFQIMPLSIVPQDFKMRSLAKLLHAQGVNDLTGIEDAIGNYHIHLSTVNILKEETK